VRPSLAVVAVGVVTVGPWPIKPSATAEGPSVQGHACVVVGSVRVDGVQGRWRGVEERVVGAILHEVAGDSLGVPLRIVLHFVRQAGDFVHAHLGTFLAGSADHALVHVLEGKHHG